jgi:hypothetical protein
LWKSRASDIEVPFKGCGTAQIRFWPDKAGASQAADEGRQPVFDVFCLVPPALAAGGGVLTRNTDTLLMINNLQSSDPQQIRHKPATDPKHGPD